MDRIQNIYDSYHNIIDEFGEEEITSTFSNLVKVCEEFLKENKLDNQVVINTFILAHTVMDYFTDVSRLKEFHHIRSHNSYKQHAYLMSWFLRRKPLQIIEDESEELVYTNEKFVLSYTMNFLTRDMAPDFYDKLSKKQQEAIDGYMKSLYYHLKYRNCSAQVLELSLLSFDAGTLMSSD